MLEGCGDNLHYLVGIGRRFLCSRKDWTKAIVSTRQHANLIPAPYSDTITHYQHENKEALNTSDLSSEIMGRQSIAGA
jgi:hypothetical protein